jgi:predicted nucleic acid-binding Zn ribbon protein
MDNLDIDVKNAKALGLSYGQYKALHYDPHAPVVKGKKKPFKICPVCGEGVYPPQIKFCSDVCRRKREKETKRIWAHERYLELKEMKKDGGQDADS